MKLATFDVESTGVNTDTDRIITCFLRAKDGERIVGEHSWVIDPGVEVPEGAAEVHGMDTAWVQEHGRKDVAEAISEIANALADYSRQGFVIAAYNGAYDLAILNSELERHHGEGLETSAEFREGRYIDPLCIDRAIDKFRKGSRKLVDVAQHYGIVVDEGKTHAADYDVFLTEQLIPKVLNKAWDSLGGRSQGLTPDEFVDKLQGLQAEWKRDWADHLTEYFAKTGKTEEDGSKIVVNGNFPY